MGLLTFMTLTEVIPSFCVFSFVCFVLLTLYPPVVEGTLLVRPAVYKATVKYNYFKFLIHSLKFAWEKLWRADSLGVSIEKLVLIFEQMFLTGEYLSNSNVEIQIWCNMQSIESYCYNFLFSKWEWALSDWFFLGLFEFHSNIDRVCQCQNSDQKLGGSEWEASVGSC